MLSSPETWKEFFEIYYRDELNKLADSVELNGSRSLYVNFLKDLAIFREGRLAEELLDMPDVVMRHANEGLAIAENIHDVSLEGCVARFTNLPLSRRILIRDLRSEHIAKFVAIEGIVRKVTEVRPKVVRAAFACSSCGKVVHVDQEDAQLKPPFECRACKGKRFVFLPEESISIDSQRIRIQEYPENLRGGEQPQQIDVMLEGDLTGRVNPGDRVIINGIVRAKPRLIGQRKLAHMDIHLEGNSIEILQQEYEEFEITEEDRKRIIELSEDPRIYEKIVASIAPSIYGHEDIKLAIALQLFGGVPKKLPDGTEIRGDIHVLLVGDPGVAKCVDYNTEVLLSDGSLVKIGDLVNSELRNGKIRKIDDGVYAETNLDIISLDSRFLKSRICRADIVWKRKAPETMYKIRTKTGRMIRVTPTHPFFTIKNGRFVTVRAKDLNKGDLIAAPRTIPVFGSPQPLPNSFEKSKSNNAVRLKLPEKTSPEFWRFIALFIAEGYAQKSESGCATVFFTNNDEKLLSEFLMYAKKLGLNPNVRNPHKGKSAREVIVPGVELYNFFELLGIVGKSREKRVPDLLFKCSRDEIRAFLSAFFDAEASVDRKKPKITVTSASQELLRQIQHLLLRFGIISQLHETQSRATNSRTPEMRTYFRLTITGENALKFVREIGFTVDCKRSLCVWQTKKTNPNLDVVPDLSVLLRETRRLLGLTQSECGVERTTYQHLERGDRKPSRDTLTKVVKAFRKRVDENGHDVRAEFNVKFLELLADSDIFWDEVVEITTYRPEHPYVYDLQVLEHHNFIANDIFVHNSQILRYVHRIAPRSVYTTGKGTTTAGLTATATRDEYDGRWTLEAGALVLADKGVALVDEIDKMRSEDRSALHEAMEQQSYHPSFEITLADGSKHKIGEFVDRLFEKFPERKVKGIDCEILRTDDLGIEILTTDFGGVFKTRVDRVSRHKAPDYFVRIKYSNGREILVTPEHPVFVFRDGKITTVEASKVKAGDFAPAVISCEFEGRSELQKHVSRGRKEVTLPDSVDECFATFLGFFASEGYSFAGSSMEVGLSNTNSAVILEMKEAMQKSFGVEPIDYTGVNRTLRLVSKPVYEFMHINFPELMRKSKRKRIPASILSADLDTRVAFLRAAFMGDGSVESEALCYRTSSRGLAEDYQDLLLTLGIHSRIVVDSSTNSYKVYITGDCLERFVEMVLKEIKGQNEKVKWLIERSKRNLRKRELRSRSLTSLTKHDVLPPYVGELIKACLKKLGMKYDGYFHEHLIGNYGVNRIIVERYIEAIERRIEEVEGSLDAQSLRELREKLGYSQQRVAELIGVTRSTIDYAERGGYSEEKRKTLLQKLRIGIKQVISEVRESLEKVKAMEKFRWLRIKEVEIVPNEGEYRTDWVYDVTVEPTHTFISHGLVLHNTVSVAKAGINAVLRARCALLGAANPKYGRFDRYAPIAEQIDLSPTLLSRFDLIFVLTDDPDEVRDRMLAEHILKTHELGEKLEKLKNIVSTEYTKEELEAQAEEITPAIDPELLRKYIAYSKRTVFPVLTEEAKERIIDFYVSLRSKAKDNSAVPVTARQLEALIRLAEASARLRLSDYVTAEDVERVIRIVRKSLEQIAIDPETGEIDIDYAFTGTSKSQRDKIMIIRKIVEELESMHEKGAPEEEILRMAEEEGINPHKAKEILSKMKERGDIYSPRIGYYRVVRRD
ncbi:LAGLIDADG family homing endonuclease [Archaeoglobus veneficus]|uniref:Transcriptional regulator, XRE family n=1 Tax=Archaeoglobus veneficus (strain DSM 11195 / SNP6) TaxID=693661 RepID=F2KME6_ARCVS|nr:LAGLIDADG family homing endonuclease [Archaeoglobus veneficus]AEA46045.1 transcriptional regulator, XRE family [Archaeoglobus veneficus SNP6]